MRLGVDVQGIDEVREALAAHGDRYRRRLFTECEVRDCGGWGADPVRSAPKLAARFAAKEAVLKALHVGPDPPAFTEIETRCSPDGQPFVQLHGSAEQHAHDVSLTRFNVSLSCVAGVATAVVVAQ